MVAGLAQRLGALAEAAVKAGVVGVGPVVVFDVGQGDASVNIVEAKIDAIIASTMAVIAISTVIPVATPLNLLIDSGVLN